MVKLLKFLIKTLIGLLIVVVLAAAILAAYSFFALRPFYAVAQQSFEIPGLDIPLNQQGISYDEQSECFFVTGYMTNGEACPVYVIDDVTGKQVTYARLLDENGGPNLQHSGGLEVHGNYVYVAGSERCGLYVYDRRAILDAKPGDSVSCLGIFETGVSKDDEVKVSFVGSDETMLYVGEFYLPVIPLFKLCESHAVGPNHALTVGFAFDDGPDAVFGLKPVPSVAYSMPDAMQGVTFDGSRMFTSHSFFAFPSTLNVYDLNAVTSEGTIQVMGVEVPLKVFTQDKADKSMVAPPMSEEIDHTGDRIYIMSEGASLLYKVGALYGSDRCWTLPESLS